MLARLKARYDAFTRRQLDSLSAIERSELEAFDRWLVGGRGWRTLIAAIAATTLAAWPASALMPRMTFVDMAILLNVVAVSLLVTAFVSWFGYRKLCTQVLRQSALGVLGAIVGALIALAGFALFTDFDVARLFADDERVRTAWAVVAAFVFVHLMLLVLVASLRNREYRALAAHLEAERERGELSRRVAESKLRMLQLQIEPHFLFNTLASAQQLAERPAPDAARMIANLIRLLRAATPALTDDHTTLAQEGQLVHAYLEIMAKRLGSRLAYAVTIPPGLAAARVPPGMLITLVENAIKHGIEPLAEGGRVDVIAQRLDDGRLQLVVQDDGAGVPGSTTGQGIGLANIRERLALLYGASASLETGPNRPSGFVARLTLPELDSNPTPDKR